MEGERDPKLSGVSEQDAQPHVGRARKLLHKRLRVVTRDGRTLLGDFHCMDKQQNIILLHAAETGVNPQSGEDEERMLGQVMVPLAQRASCEVLVSWAEEGRVRAVVEGDEWPPLPS